ncbi:phage terminase large subunit [Rhizobium leguminosarum]|uniref:phage terminase large subunit n=1 Tax=Rhizobium leguminosarum TaxID=384 RepID=UPI001C96A90A|nr:phage terminase large subunit [Rhizobium leguminosarum]
MTNLKSSTALNVQADPILSNFKNFLFLVWKQFLDGKLPTPVQYDIADFLQHGPKRSVIEAFRGVGKSWVTSAFVVWCLLRNPNLNILVVSASKQRSDDFSIFTMRIILEMPMCAHLRPGPDQRSSMIAFDVGPAAASHAPSVKSLGINSQIAGSRADVLIADDIEVPNNSDTQIKRDLLGEKVKEFDAVLKPGGRIIYLGTPQSEQSLYNVLPERGYIMRVWPARYPTEAQLAKYGPRLAPMITKALAAAADRGEDIAGRSTDPQRFSDTDLSERELSYGRSGFALQFMLDTSLSDADKFPLKLSDLIVMPMDINRAPKALSWASGQDQRIDHLQAVGLPGDGYYRPMWYDKDSLPYEGSVMFVDPSGRGGDETVWAVVKHLHGNLFLTALGCARNKGYDKTVLRDILKCAAKQKVNKILVEPNFGDGMFAQLLRNEAQALNVYKVEIEDSDWAKNQKEVRIIDTLEPIMNQHRLIVDEAVIDWDYKSTEAYAREEQTYMRLMYQLTRLTAQRGSLAKDDRVDALAGAVAYWIEFLARNDKTSAKQMQEDALQAELDKFLDFFGDGAQGSALRFF